ncbi:sulfite exporter TauE/SafE family protein [soil metagenome]
MTGVDLALAACAAFAGGMVNAVAGGGSLITFPTLVALGLPPLIANVTNTVALCPGYLGATYTQRKELVGQGKRLSLLIPVGVVGGAAGALLLLRSGERAFEHAIPYLILTAALLVGLQDRLRTFITSRNAAPHAVLAAIPIAAAAVYGGYFGAGLGVMILASLGITLADSLTRLNAIKHPISLGVNIAAAVVFTVRAPVVWPYVAVMAVAALLGGAVGGAISLKVPVKVLRTGIVVLGVTIAVIYFLRT